MLHYAGETIIKSNMPIITLTSDWGLKDHYLAAVKGKILNNLPDAQIIDISHNIKPFDIEQAAFVIKNSYKNFPKETIHIIGVGTEESDKYSHTVISHEGHYFIGTDSGVFSMIFDKTPEKIFELDIPQDSDHFTFSSRDRFVKAAVHIAKGKKLEEFGNKKESLIEKILFRPVVENNLIKGLVIYIDEYENIITNINEKLFKEIGKNKKFSIMFRGESVNKIHYSYNDVSIGEIVAIFNSINLLEIALNQGNASSLLGLSVDDSVMIEFEE